MNLTLKSLLCALLLTVTARADDVYVRSGKEAAELPFKNVTIIRVKDGELYFAINIRETHRPIGEISRIEIAGETQFNAAEKAFSEAHVARDEAAAKPKFSEAVSGYQATIGSTNKPWLKEYAAIRMQTAAPKSGRFDAALTAWKAMVERDPVAALHTKPSVEGIDPKSQYLIAAVRDLTTLVNSTPKPEAKRAYLDLLNDVQTAMGDTEGAIKTAEMRVALGGTPEEVAELALKQAQADLANKKYDAALERLGKVNLTSLSDSARAEASFLTAECKAARLQPNAPADEWKDAAIEYMRVVTAFPSSANAAAALLKVAQIHETLKEPEAALRIYQQVAREHANTPAAQAAQKAIERLGGRQAAAGK
jgi:tetratricopeptide (TPR) repeat protein